MSTTTENLYPWYIPNNPSFEKRPYDEILIECNIRYWFLIFIQTIIVVGYTIYQIYKLKDKIVRRTIFYFCILCGCQIWAWIIECIQIWGNYDESAFDNKLQCKSNIYTCSQEMWGTEEEPSECFLSMVNQFQQIFHIRTFLQMVQFFLQAVLILVIFKWVEILDICKVQEMTQLKESMFSDDSNQNEIIQGYVKSLETFLKHKRTNRILLIVYLVSTTILLIDDQLKYWFRFAKPNQNQMSSILVLRIITRLLKFIVCLWISIIFFNTLK